MRSTVKARRVTSTSCSIFEALPKQQSTKQRSVELTKPKQQQSLQKHTRNLAVHTEDLAGSSGNAVSKKSSEQQEVWLSGTLAPVAASRVGLPWCGWGPLAPSVPGAQPPEPLENP